VGWSATAVVSQARTSSRKGRWSTSSRWVAGRSWAGGWVQWRHQQARDVVAEPSAVVTFGFLLAPDESGSLRVAEFTCVQGPIEMPDHWTQEES
ncbi:hypothetical protein AB0L40_16805, partial [Patulibacter sp. NPDC049589]